MLTVNPLANVVLSVLIPWWIGVAKPRFIGYIDLRAVRLRNAWLRFRASRRDAMSLGSKDTMF